MSSSESWQIVLGSTLRIHSQPPLLPCPPPPRPCPRCPQIPILLQRSCTEAISYHLLTSEAIWGVPPAVHKSIEMLVRTGWLATGPPLCFGVILFCVQDKDCGKLTLVNIPLILHITKKLTVCRCVLTSLIRQNLALASPCLVCAWHICYLKFIG